MKEYRLEIIIIAIILTLIIGTYMILIQNKQHQLVQIIDILIRKWCKKPHLTIDKCEKKL